MQARTWVSEAPPLNPKPPSTTAPMGTASNTAASTSIGTTKPGPVTSPCPATSPAPAFNDSSTRPRLRGFEAQLLISLNTATMLFSTSSGRCWRNKYESSMPWQNKLDWTLYLALSSSQSPEEWTDSFVNSRVKLVS
jgi:hypothetical protein